jgi:MoxR-like ATPase
MPEPPPQPKDTFISNPDALMRSFERLGYIIDYSLATAVYLMIRLRKPLLIEGHAGLGKTEAAKSLASSLGTELIRLQCYEGLDVNSAVYEWNYQKQLLAIRIREGQQTADEREHQIFSRDYLLERPLLRSILAQSSSPVLLIDEIDRADEAFEAFLLELLSDFQVSIPELGTIRASYIPHVILTSNRTRELSDALKRRCLYRGSITRASKEMRIIAHPAARHRRRTGKASRGLCSGGAKVGFVEASGSGGDFGLRASRGFSGASFP